MKCERTATGFICCTGGSTKRCGCGNKATKLCDYKLTGPKSGKTCDKPLCSKCAVTPTAGVDYCRVHAAMLNTESGKLF